MRLEGKVAVVTGASRGIGRGIAIKLAQEGAAVVIGDILFDQMQGVVDEIASNGGRVVAQKTDISVKEEAEGLLQRAIDEFGKLDILVNNAGIIRDGMLHKMADEQWFQVLDVILNGTFYTTRFAAKYMRERQEGRIINISSGSWLGNVGQANYAAAKAGVVGLTLTAARELGRKNVTANVICPGFIDTDMTRSIPPQVWDKVIEKIPMQKAGKPEDVANLIAYLASDEAGYITGEIINVSGGYIV